MAKDLNTPAVINPLLFWNDLGMRATEMAVSSSQTMGEAVDRFVRAGAGVESGETPTTSPVASEAPETSLPLVSAEMQRLQRTMFDLMAQGWAQWISSLGTFMSLGTGFSRQLAEQTQTAPRAMASADAKPRRKSASKARVHRSVAR
jgi:hypothetical protein